MDFDFTAFELQRMFWGEGDMLFLLEIVVRVIIIYFYSVFLLRLLGNEGMKEMSFLDYFLVIALGSAAGDPMFYPSVPLIYGLITITTVIVLKQIITKITIQNDYLRKMTQSDPKLLIKDGYFDEKFIRKHNITSETLFANLRLSGIKDIGEVERCYLEYNGELSIFSYNNKKDCKKTYSIFPAKNCQEE